MNTLLQTCEKISELEYALMTTESTGLAQLPIHLVRIAAIDADNNAWFVIPFPSQKSEAFGDNISVRLDFYKKGMPYFMCVEGIAELITNTENVPDADSFQYLRTMIWKKNGAAIKVKIETEETFGEPLKTAPVPAKGIGGKLASVYGWLFAPVTA